LSKPLISVKMNKKQPESMQNTIKDVREHFGELLQSWGSLTEEQRQSVLEHSPCLSELKTLTEPLRS
jgi:ElaB/YqjD/DUF883 family membrane-anchored ribosome-binding protein